MAVRLNKYLADRGVAARRKCDELIAEGRVSVNGRIVSEAGSKVEEDRDRVSVDGRAVGGKERTVYFVLNKPVGVITTLDDPEGRRSIRDLLPRGARVYPVGRLDADTSGLLLLTNDGELAHKLMHPRFGVPKVYRVRLAAEPRADQLRRLASGVRFDPVHKDMVSGPARVRSIDPGFDAIMIEIIIHEGRFRQVRRMCEAVGLEVTGLHRVGYGPLSLGPLARGMFRELSEDEVARLKRVSARAGGSGRPRRAGEADSEESDRKLERAATSERPARPQRPVPATRTARPRVEARAPRGPEAPGNEDDAVIEETWLPGGGFLARADDDDESDLAPSDEAPAAEWPARPSARRGDAAWQAESGRLEAPARADRPRGSAPRRAAIAPANDGVRPESAPAGRSQRGGVAPRNERSRAAGPRRDGFAPKRDPFARGDRARGGAPRSARAERGGVAPREERPRGSGPRTGGGRRDEFTPKRDAVAPRSGRPERAGGFTPRSGRPERAGGIAPRSGRPERAGGIAPRSSRPERAGGFTPRGKGLKSRKRPGASSRAGSATHGGPASRFNPRDEQRAGRGAPARRAGGGGPRTSERRGPGGRPARDEGRPVGKSTRRAAPRGRVRPSGGPARKPRPTPASGPGAFLRQGRKKPSRRKER